MDFKKEQIEYLAELAKLEISQSEKEAMYGQLSNILNYVGQLNEVTISAVDRFSDPVKNINVWRDDIVAPPVDDVRQCILDNAPQQEDGLIKTKPVFHYDE
ncbi:MAG: Asp-tRNA(Asn)/Glu-tRNA(Gln) amidotransferase subunit GatC [Candidatus Komeilibacteria bacterium]